LTSMGGKLYFAANAGSGRTALGVELWTSDGTAAGTHPVADINPGPAGSNPAGLTPGTDATGKAVLYFTADDGTYGIELWKYAGTPASMVAALRSRGSSTPSGLLSFDGSLLFTADTAPTPQLWIHQFGQPRDDRAAGVAVDTAGN